jgi:hypothetical protein
MSFLDVRGIQISLYCLEAVKPVLLTSWHQKLTPLSHDKLCAMDRDFHTALSDIEYLRRRLIKNHALARCSNIAHVYVVARVLWRFLSINLDVEYTSGKELVFSKYLLICESRVFNILNFNHLLGASDTCCAPNDVVC